MTLAADADVSERDVIGFYRQHLAHVKAPVAVAFGPLPKTSTGRIRKNVLREAEWAGRRHAIT